MNDHDPAATPAPGRHAGSGPRGAGTIGPVAGGMLGACLLVLVAAVAAVIALWMRGDRPGSGRAVGLAVAACLPGMVAAWVLTWRPAADPGRALAASVGAITLRTLPPLAALAWLSTPRQPDEGGASSTEAAGMLVAFYLALLAADVLLHIMLDGKGRARGH